MVADNGSASPEICQRWLPTWLPQDLVIIADVRVNENSIDSAVVSQTMADSNHQRIAATNGITLSDEGGQRRSGPGSCCRSSCRSCWSLRCLLGWLSSAVLAAQLASRLRASWEGDPGSAV